MRRLGPSVLLLAGLAGIGCKRETANQPPVAYAGDDQLALRGDPITLDGTGSFDPDDLAAPDALTYSWDELSGPTAGIGSITSTLQFDADGAGSYVFQLTVTDKDKATASDIVAVEVQNVLSVTHVVPGDGALGVSGRQPVIVFFDQAIRPWTAGASVRIDDVTDPANPVAVEGNVTLEDDGTAVTFSPVVDWADLAEYQVTVTTDVLALDGATLRTEAVSAFTGALLDTVPPTVVFASPGPEGATGVPHSTYVEIVFSEPVDPALLTSSLQLAGGGPVDGVVSLGAGGTRALFVPADTSGPTPDPQPLTAGASYVASVLDTLTDLSGNALDGDDSGAAGGDFTRSFQIAAGTDTTKPVILSVSPLRGAQGVSVKLPVVITFSEPVEPATVAGALTLTSSGAAFGPGAAIAGTITMTRGNTVALFQPAANLTTGTIYQVAVGSTITDLAGQTLPAAFDSFYVTGDAPPPDVLLAIPDRAPIASSLVVDVVGEDFVDGATVFVPGGGVLVNDATYLSGTQLQLDLTIAPSAAIGLRSITVTNPDGQAGTGLNVFEILPLPPSITSLSPAAANLGDVSVPVSVLGADFQNGATVSISGTGVTVDSVTFANAGQLDLTVSVAGGASTGARSVTVTNPDGQSALASNAFTVRFPAPTVTNISQGAGGQGESLFSVIITGTGFLTSPQLPTVDLGSGVLAATVTANATTVTVNITVSGTATLGAHDVVVTNPDGQPGTLASAFTVNAAPPSVVSSTPAVSQGTTVPVTVSGTGFQCPGVAFQVRQGGAPSVGVTVDNATFIACNATSFTRNVTVNGTAVVGLHDLRVTNPDTQFKDGANTFQVREELPQISGISVAQGRRKQTLGVNVNGTFFQSGPTPPVVSFGPGIAVSVDSVTPTQIQTTISITDTAALTTRNVVVTNADGQSASFNGFTVQKATPDLVTVAPAAGSQGTAVGVTLTGDDFDCTGSPGVVPVVDMGANVTVSAVACPGTTVSENSLTLTATLNAGAGVGVHAVTVTNPDGALDTLPASFTVREEAPTLAGVPLTPVASGRRKQTVALTVNGTFFQANPTVSFGSDIAVSVGAVTATTIAVTLNIGDPAALGARNVVVTNADGQSVTGTNIFTVNKAPPDLVSLAPVAGSQGTAFTVTLSGDDFDCTGSPGVVPGVNMGTNVTVSGVTCPGTSVSENSLTLTATLNAGAGVGLHDVVVTNPDTAADTLTGSFTVREEAPALAGVPLTPVASGRRKQTLAVTINGTFFQANPVVSFGSNIAVSVGAVTATTIDVTLSIADTAALGTRNVVVTNADGQSVTGTNIFTVNKAPPDLVSLAPAIGSQGTSFLVTLSGDDFDCTLSPGTVPGVNMGTNVTVSGVTCPGTTVSENSLTLTATLNAGAGVGTHDVTVTNPDGALDTLTGSFVVREEAPTLSGVPLTPVASGRRKQTLAVTINGTFFQANPVVSFGSNIAVSVGAVTATTIDVTLNIADTAALGARNVVVTNADGQSVTGTNIFTVQKAPPDLVSLAPAAGSQGTAFTVTLTGDDFDCTLSPGTVPGVNLGTNVTVSAVTCPGTTVSENSLQLTATLNAGAGVGVHDVTVTNPDGAFDTLTGSFTVREEAPTLSGVPLTPVASGRRKQTLALVVNGTFFQANPTVSFGSDIAVSVGAVTATTIAVSVNIADTAVLGARNVVVTNVDGQSVTGTNIFTVNKAAPDLVSLAPAAGSQGTAFTVTLSGDDFDCTLSPGTVPGVNMGTNVTVTGITCPGTTVSENSLTLTATLNAGAGVGLHDVIVTNPDGATDSLTGSFTVREEAPTLSGTPITPVTSGRRKQSLALTLSGTFFQANPVVSFGSNILVSVGTVTATTIDVTISITDPAALGARNVTVTNADGQSVTGTNIFTVNKALPDVTSVAPASGSQGTAFSVTASGDDFDCTGSPGVVPNVSLGTNVTISAITCPGSTVSENTLTFTATLNAGAGVGVHDVTVTNPDGGADVLLGGFTVREEVPTVTALQDSAGVALPLVSRKSTYSNARVIGTFFQSGATVSFGSNVTVASTTFVSAARIDVTFTVLNTAPLGDLTITVTNPDGQVGVNTTATDVRLPAPSIATVVPTEGNEGNAALSVAVTGQDFQCATTPTMSFGAGIVATVNGPSCTATSVTVSLNIASNAGPGLRNVTLTNVDGQSGTGVGFFEVLLEKPVVTSANVIATGLPQARRNTSVTVRILGDFFQSLPSVPNVTFGSGVGVAAVTFVNAQTLDVDISVSPDPALAALGLRNVTVTNADTQAATLTNGFTILRALPSISSIVANAGSQQDAPFAVTITGDHFDCSGSPGAVPQVDLGANITVAAESCGGSTSQRATSLTGTVTIAATATIGLHNVDVLNPGDSASGSGTNLFTVREERPVVTSVAPNIRQGSTLTMTLTGNFFQATPTSITTPAGTVSNIVWVSATTVTFTLAVPFAPILAGNYDLSLTNPDGQSVTGTGLVVVLNALPPTISSVCNPTGDCGPAWVDQGANDRVLTINGSDFQPTVSLAFSGAGISDVNILSVTPTAISVRIDVAGGAALGLRDVTVTNLDSTPNQNSGATGNGQLDITLIAPTVTLSNPVSAPQNTNLNGGDGPGGAPGVTLTGTNFRAGATVEYLLGGSPDGNLVVSSVAVLSTRITLELVVGPASIVGARNIRVTNSDGSEGTLASGFSVAPGLGSPFVSSVVRDPVRAAATFRTDSANSLRQQPAAQLFHILGGSFSTAVAPTITISGAGITAGAASVNPAGTRIDVSLTAPCGDLATGPRDIIIANAPAPNGNGLTGICVDCLVLHNGVVINELDTTGRTNHLAFGANHEVMEIFNGSGCDVNLTDWRLDILEPGTTTANNGIYVIGDRTVDEIFSAAPAGNARATFKPGGYLMIDRPFDAANDNLDDDCYVSFTSKTGRFIDDVEIGPLDVENDGTTDGAPSAADNGDNGSATDEMVGRCPNGNDTDNDINDFFQEEQGASPSVNGMAATDNATNDTQCSAQCSDGVDNDADGWVDMLDDGCTDPDTDNTEAAASVAQCNNNVNDDATGGTDEADPDCFSAADNDESN